MRLLIVEDDVKLVRALKRGLEREGYGVDVAYDGDEALERATAHDYDAVVLDLMLHGRDGFAVCEAIRRSHTDVRDRIRGLDTGADDYLVKPFDFGELVARLRALSRRPAAVASEVLRVGDLELDLTTQRVRRAGQDVPLSVKEIQVLEVFMRHAGEVISRYQLLEGAWDTDYEHRSNVIEVYVRYLREKLDRPFGRSSFETVRGAGYRLRTD